MRGIVLAAGGGRRLRPLTDELPKTLLEVDGERTILEVVLASLAEAGVEDATVVTGHGAEHIAAVAPVLEDRYRIAVELRFNPRYATANNAYSLWLTRDRWDEGALVANGDTVHPAEVERLLLAARGRAPLLLAIDDVKALAEEEMKVLLDADGGLVSISKQLDPRSAAGEYIGVCLIEPEIAGPLADALASTVERDPDRYYEDGFQAFADAGGAVAAVPIGRLPWIEVDDHRDLEAARALRSVSAPERDSAVRTSRGR